MFSKKRNAQFIAKFAHLLVSSAVTLALFFGISTTVGAQNEDDENSPLEEIIVTGTRKEGRLITEALSPIDVISGAALGYQAAADLTDALTKLDPALSTQRFPIADGTAFVRPVVLRNLPPTRLWFYLTVPADTGLPW